MAHELIKAAQSAGRKEQYEVLVPQIEALVKGEGDIIANVSNICAAIHQTFNYLWVGVYFVKAEELVLGPFQGPVACTRIQFGKGVCGKSWQEAKTIVVPDVELFPGHIACSSSSKSEIVVPVIVNGQVKMVLDIDSDQLNDFSKVDELYLVKIANLIEKLYL